MKVNVEIEELRWWTTLTLASNITYYTIQKYKKYNYFYRRYVCCFYIDIDPDDTFVVVKRILGKHGNNMRRVAMQCESKIRLRGRGSGFLEGPERKESDDPLQLHVSCVEYFSKND